MSAAEGAGGDFVVIGAGPVLTAGYNWPSWASVRSSSSSRTWSAGSRARPSIAAIFDMGGHRFSPRWKR